MPPRSGRLPDAFQPALESLATELLTIQATGDYARAQKLVKDYGTPPDSMVAGIKRLADIPVDVDPVYPLTGIK